MAISSIQVSESLVIHLCTGPTGDDPHVLIERQDAGLVRVEAGELLRLADVLTLAAGDLAGPGDPPAEDPDPEPPEWINEGGLWGRWDSPAEGPGEGSGEE